MGRIGKWAVLATACAATVACGHRSDLVSAPAAISDVAAMQQRTDSRFDVTCKDGHREVVTSEQVQLNNVCPSLPLPPPAGTHVAKGQDQNFTLPNGQSDKTVQVFGQGLWEGFMSFSLACTCDNGTDYVTVQDALGGTWTLQNKQKVDFSRLVLPVTFKSSTDMYYQSSVAMTGVTYEITKVNPILGGVYEGRSDLVSSPGRLGSDIPGVKMSFVANLRLFHNFTNDNLCGRVIISGQNSSVTLDAAHLTATTTDLIAPLTISVSPTCQSTRLPSPENKDKDYELTIPVIQIGDPV